MNSPMNSLNSIFLKVALLCSLFFWFYVALKADNQAQEIERFENKIVLLKDQLAEFFEVTPRTIDNYLSRYEQELKNNGYEVIQGKRLKSLREALLDQFGNETDFISTKTTQIGVFDFRAFLNISMLIAESDCKKAFSDLRWTMMF